MKIGEPGIIPISAGLFKIFFDTKVFGRREDKKTACVRFLQAQAVRKGFVILEEDSDNYRPIFSFTTFRISVSRAMVLFSRSFPLAMMSFT